MMTSISPLYASILGTRKCTPLVWPAVLGGSIWSRDDVGVVLLFNGGVRGAVVYLYCISYCSLISVPFQPVHAVLQFLLVVLISILVLHTKVISFPFHI